MRLRSEGKKTAAAPPRAASRPTVQSLPGDGNEDARSPDPEACVQQRLTGPEAEAKNNLAALPKRAEDPF